MSQRLLLLPVGGEGTGLGLKVPKVSAKQGSWTPHLGKMLFHWQLLLAWVEKTDLAPGLGGGGWLEMNSSSFWEDQSGNTPQDLTPSISSALSPVAS